MPQTPAAATQQDSKANSSKAFGAMLQHMMFNKEAATTPINDLSESPFTLNCRSAYQGPTETKTHKAPIFSLFPLSVKLFFARAPTHDKLLHRKQVSKQPLKTQNTNDAESRQQYETYQPQNHVLDPNF